MALLTQRFLGAGSGGLLPRCWVDTDGGWNGSNEGSVARLLAALPRAALLKIARGKGA